PDLYINYRLWNLQDTRGTSMKNIDMLKKIEDHFGVNTPRNIEVTHKKSIPIKNRLYLHYDTEFIWPALHLPVLGTKGFCYGLKSHIGILVDGTVVPCCLDKEGNIPLGNINESSIDEILNSDRSLAIIKGFQQRKLVENLCQRCQYIERFN
ncbi:MAG: SPASM domain-containing protein, partial [Bdellovibrionales bacterium]|nr:SPASM domain-containing protein [Bdellovibrionales bacterium]